MTLMHDNPAILSYILHKNLEIDIEKLKCYASVGVDEIELTECFSGGELISGSHFQKFVFPYTKKLIEKMRKRKIKVIYWFEGDVNLRLDMIKKLGVDALAVEDSKKYGDRYR